MSRSLRLARDVSFAAALLAIPVVILDEAAGTGVEPARIANWVLWSVFAFELLLVARRYRWKTVREEPMLLLLVVLTTPVAPPGLQGARVLGLLPLLRLAAVAGALRHVTSLDGLRYAGVLLVLVVFGGGLLLPVLEPSQHLTGGDGVWWALQTVTTVGYGDIVPHTDAGRALGAVVMLTGIGTATLVIGAAARRFLETPDDGKPTLEQRIQQLTASVDALREEVRQLRRGSP